MTLNSIIFCLFFFLRRFEITNITHSWYVIIISLKLITFTENLLFFVDNKKSNFFFITYLVNILHQIYFFVIWKYIFIFDLIKSYSCFVKCIRNNFYNFETRLTLKSILILLENYIYYYFFGSFCWNFFGLFNFLLNIENMIFYR